MLELLKKLFVNLDEQKVLNVSLRCLCSGCSKEEIITVLDNALEEIGEKYSEMEYTLSDLIMAGIIYKEVISMPEFDVTRDIEKDSNSGSILLGTIKGDIHDIGKSIFKSIATTSGFNVIDLGVDISPRKFCNAVKKYNPDILAISVIVTSSISSIAKVINLLKDEGLRQNIKIIIGGSIVSDTVCKFVGSDAFTKDAKDGIEICRKWMNSNE